MNLRDGDVVHVRVTIRDDEVEHGTTVIVGNHVGKVFGVKRENILHVEPRPVSVGAMVRWSAAIPGEYEVRAVDGEALLLRRDGRHFVADVSQVERI